MSRTPREEVEWEEDRGGGLGESGQGDGKKAPKLEPGPPLLFTPAPCQVLSLGKSILSHLPSPPGGTQSY